MIDTLAWEFCETLRDLKLTLTPTSQITGWPNLKKKRTRTIIPKVAKLFKIYKSGYQWSKIECERKKEIKKYYKIIKSLRINKYDGNITLLINLKKKHSSNIHEYNNMHLEIFPKKPAKFLDYLSTIFF